jgi:hypothetical protein
MLVDVSRDGDICTVTINRPEVLNPLSTQVFVELEPALDQIAADDSVNVVVVTGAGDKSFVAGADLAEMRDMSPAEAYALSTRAHRVFSKLENLPQPTIAAVNGFAIGAGWNWPSLRHPYCLRQGQVRARKSLRHHPRLRRHSTAAPDNRAAGPRDDLAGRTIDAQEAAAIGWSTGWCLQKNSETRCSAWLGRSPPTRETRSA